MKIVNGVAAALAAGSMLLATPASAGSMSQAEKLRKLDIMLMVTGLRCRTTPANFQSDYGRFTTAHYAELQGAANTLKSQFVASLGARGADRALDRMSVTMANAYGQGHPWLDCGQLKQVAQNLAAAKGAAPLLEAADQLIPDDGAVVQTTLVRR